MGSGQFQQRYSWEPSNLPLHLILIEEDIKINSTYSESKRSHLRADIRAKRRALSTNQQQDAAIKLFAHIQTLPEFTLAQNLAFYIPIDGEISPRPLIDHAHKLGKQCYLPVLSTDGQKTLLFVEYNLDSTLQKGPLSLSQPVVEAGNVLPAPELDTVFMPLVAFDHEGSRLGMGGGYYDRSFAFLADNRSNKPILVGIAHECQRVEKLQVASWDVPLKKIVTDQKIYQAS